MKKKTVYERAFYSVGLQVKCDTENPPDNTDDNNSRRAANVNGKWLRLIDDRSGALFRYDENDSGAAAAAAVGRESFARLSPGKQQPAVRRKPERPPAAKDDAGVTSEPPKTAATATYQRVNIVRHVKSENVTGLKTTVRPSSADDGVRDYRDNRDYRDYRDYRDHRDSRDNRDNRDYRDHRDNRDDFYRPGGAAAAHTPRTVDDTADAETISPVDGYSDQYSKMTTAPNSIRASETDGENDNVRERNPDGSAERISTSDNKTADAADECDDTVTRRDHQPRTTAGPPDECRDDNGQPPYKTREICDDDDFMLFVENNIRLKLVANSKGRTVFRDERDGGTKPALTTNSDAAAAATLEN